MIYDITNKRVYNTIAEAAAATGISPSSISRASRQQRITAGGIEWAVVTGTGRQLGASKRAATMRAKKAAAARAAAEAARKSAKAAAQAAKDAEKQRKEAEREQKRREKEHRKAVREAKRAVRFLQRKRKEKGISKQVSGMIGQMLRSIDGTEDVDLEEFEEYSTQSLQEITREAVETFDSIAAIEGKEDVGKIALVFGMSQWKAEQMHDELKKVLENFGAMREFLTSTLGEAGYKAFNLRDEYQMVVSKGSRMTPKMLKDLLTKINDEIIDNNRKTAEDITRVISEWAGEAGKGGGVQPRTPITPRR